MSYETQAALAEDTALHARITVCAAGLGVPEPYSWMFQHRWKLAATKGWDTAVEAAADGVMTRMDPVQPISDEMILAAVANILHNEQTQEAGG